VATKATIQCISHWAYCATVGIHSRDAGSIPTDGEGLNFFYYSHLLHNYRGKERKSLHNIAFCAFGFSPDLDVNGVQSVTACYEKQQKETVKNLTIFCRMSNS
jgi:hypothetical protein